MCCLIKTTSRSENANSFFNSFLKIGNNLFQFMLGFEFALEKQRREQHRLDYHTRTTLPKWLTYIKMERHACDIYTRSVFFEVQTEIHRAAWTCSIKSVNSDEKAETYLIEHLDKRDEKIAYCNHIDRHGYLCRHVFKVLLNAGVESIPEKKHFEKMET
ncbi:hypothetical protein Ccrd_017456 [Cynara cardunculus var. scolymus]|uniref:Protein FAR1-RELATED SEQUENCE n=1 Tax=Cynara cardunculus var. scolymus TaxID=59895 RepID=A0A118K2E1_CYNCS|nr:hypothetical protein Ccrd_017456 [Cynara cardunculus var. scolymus]